VPEPTMPRSQQLRILVLAVLCTIAGFGAARTRYFLYPEVQDVAQNGTREWVNTWAGIRVLQYPNDLLVYQELIAEQQPDWVIETGTHAGGLTLFLSGVLQTVKPEGRVLTVDLSSRLWDETVSGLAYPGARELLRRIEFINGSSTAPEVLARVRSRIGAGQKVLVILDSLHDEEHVLSEMRLYGELVQPGGYLVVTDTHLDRFWATAGPRAAIRAYLKEHPDFSPDTSRERFMVSANLGGWLRRNP
jgi:cephalosporin hydroxylase